MKIPKAWFTLLLTTPFFVVHVTTIAVWWLFLQELPIKTTRSLSSTIYQTITGMILIDFLLTFVSLVILGAVLLLLSLIRLPSKLAFIEILVGFLASLSLGFVLYTSFLPAGLGVAYALAISQSIWTAFLIGQEQNYRKRFVTTIAR